MRQQQRGGPNDVITIERQTAIEAFEKGDYTTAAQGLVSLLARTAPDAVLLRLCGMALLRSNAPAQGLPYLARARRLAPHDPVAALWHGIGLHAAGQLELAVATLQQSATLAAADPVPLVHLARALLQLGRPADAASAAQRAMALAPSLPDARHVAALAELECLQRSDAPRAEQLAEAWLMLGQACMRLDKVLEAQHAFEQALSLQPHHVEVQVALALVDHLCGQPVRAIQRLRDLLERAPDYTAARLALATRVLMDNDPSHTLSLLRTEPPAAHAERVQWQACRIAALGMLGRDQDAEAELARVRPPVGAMEIVLRWQHAQMARRAGDHAMAAGLSGQVAVLASMRDAAALEDRIEAHFSLAQLRHAEARHELAFLHWSRGHALLGLAQPFSRSAHAATLEAVTGARPLAIRPTGAADRSPVFIVGLPRTGTTLAEQILGAHAQVHGAGERLAIREMLVALTETDDAAEAARRAAALDPATLEHARMEYLQALHTLAPRARIVLDKMPDNFMHLGFVEALLPGARVICCTRDLRDVGASIYQHRFLGDHPYAHDLGDLGWYIAQHQKLLVHWRQTLRVPLLELDHADWIADFDGTLRRVLDFLDLPWDPACMRFFEQERDVRTASRDQVRQPINARGVGRWRPYAASLAPMLRELPS